MTKSLLLTPTLLEHHFLSLKEYQELDILNFSSGGAAVPECTPSLGGSAPCRHVSGARARGDTRTLQPRQAGDRAGQAGDVGGHVPYGPPPAQDAGEEKLQRRPLRQGFS